MALFFSADSSRSNLANLLRDCDCRKMKNIRGTTGGLDEAWRSSGCVRAWESERQWRIASVNSRMKEDETERERTVRRTCGRYTVVSGLLAAGRRFERYALRAPTWLQCVSAINDPTQQCVVCLVIVRGSVGLDYTDNSLKHIEDYTLR